VRTFDKGDQVEVIDQGCGIPKEKQQQIFEKFASAEDIRHETSLGLGLTFCKLAVETHHGQIEVQSEEGMGSTFCIYLPKEPQPSPPLSA
jgi:signal transduction histidine kinase